MSDLAHRFADSGFAVFDRDPRVSRWATRAFDMGSTSVADPEMRAKWLRHGQTWFVGVDVLPNDTGGAVDGVPLDGPWRDLITPPALWHRAQVSVVYRGYPQQDPSETEATHRYRVNRAGAHVDGLHLEQGRRIVRECHGFILGVPLNTAVGCPLVVWKHSHRVIRTALRSAIGARDPLGVDVTDAYKDARQMVFDTCEKVEVRAAKGQSILLDRHIVHGIAPDDGATHLPDAGRMVAYFRPECAEPRDWV